jgi:gas vesicle protein
MNNERVYYSHDAEMHAMRVISVLSLFFLMVGLVIGAGMALLFAPTTGKKVRENLSKSMEQGWNHGRDALEPVVKKAEKEMTDLRHNVEEHLKS